MSKRKKKIRLPKERAILSDTLPYEVPICFSNRYYFRFLVENEIEYDGISKIKYKNRFQGSDKDAFDLILGILFKAPSSNNESIEINPWTFRKVPFAFKIKHKSNNFRELAVPHPINQLKLIKFYDDFKEQILYYSSISNFSIRKPTEISRFAYFNDKLHQDNSGEKSDSLELTGKEYESLKTFFSYEKYTNIYQFYEDYRYQRAEKKYNKLFTFDIGKCFDSIYTHSIAWAVLGLESVKENINESKKSFSGLFDQFIQQANYGETNGIIIGPEFSRIFAEIILQKIDFDVELILIEKGLIFGKDYQLNRYVDDYFLFCNDNMLKEEIEAIFKHQLKLYKLSINDLKSLEYNRPIITEVTLAKEKILELFIDQPKFEIFENDSSTNEESRINKLVKSSFDSNRFATKYKTIIHETKIGYTDVLNYTLAIINNKLDTDIIRLEKLLMENRQLELTHDFSNHELLAKRRLEHGISQYFVSLIDFVFFIYSVSPMVNSTVKVCHFLSKIMAFFGSKYSRKFRKSGLKNEKFYSNTREIVFKKILDESTFVLDRNKVQKYAQVESLYLLITLKDLGREYRLNELALTQFLGGNFNKRGKIIFEDTQLNYFVIVVTLLYIGNSPKYPELKEAILKYTLNYISLVPSEKRTKSSEITHLLLDIMACPFIDVGFKKKLLILYRNDQTETKKRKTRKDAIKIASFVKHQKYWFTKWERLDLFKEFESKKSQEVYS